ESRVLGRHFGRPVRVVLAGRQPGPLPLVAGLDNLGVLLADVGIQQDAGAHAVLVQDVHDPPDAHARAVLTPAEVHRVRIEVRRRLGVGGAALAGLEVLDVQPNPECHSGAVRPLERWPPRDRPVRITRSRLCHGPSSSSPTRRGAHVPAGGRAPGPSERCRPTRQPGIYNPAAGLQTIPDPAAPRPPRGVYADSEPALSREYGT